MRRWLGSWWAILVTLGLLIAQGPMLAHLLIVRHVTCEHGELIEGSGHAARHEPAAAATSDADEARDRVTPGSGGESGHDHCDALALRHCPTEVGLVIGPALLLEIEERASLGASAEQRPVPLLSLAPKSSPPSILGRA
jgi:hypothetical protein